MTIISKLDAFTDDIIGKYRNGMSACKIAKEYKTTTTTVTTLLKKFGVMQHLKRGEHDSENYIDRATAIDMFNNGFKPTQIIKQLNRSKCWFYELAKRENFDLRGHIDEFPTEEQKLKHSQTKQVNAIMNESEKVLYNMLTENGLSPIPQYSIGTKNVDFAIPDSSIVIELCCRGTANKYLASGYLAERVKQLGQFGWHVYVLFAYDTNTIIQDGINDMLIWIDFIKRQPALRRQYRVIRRTCDLISAGCCDSNNLPSVVTFE
jgi:very-short-patch-repair endonuclease